MKLKDILIDYRLTHFISQREFAKQCGLSNSLMSILEKGINPQTGKQASPDLETYKKLADGMGITVQALFDLIGDSESVNLGRRYAADSIPIYDQPRTPEAKSLAKGIDKMSKEQREAILNMMISLYPTLFEKGNEDDDA